MVPISKSIWPLILFVCANFNFAALVRFNLLHRFSKIFSRERSSPPPPNFAPPFCAFCLIVCDFLSKTWNLGRKEGKSALSGAPEGTPPVAYGDSPLGDGAFGMAVRFPAKVQSLRVHQRLPLRGSWQSRQALTEGVRSKPPSVKKGYRNARRRFCTPKFKIILPLQQRRPPPVAETGRSCWGSGQQDARAAQGTMRMLGAATRKTRRAFQIFFHPLSLMVASACLCSSCTNSCSSGCKGSRSGYTSTSRICCFCAGQLCSAR